MWSTMNFLHTACRWSKMINRTQTSITGKTPSDSLCWCFTERCVSSSSGFNGASICISLFFAALMWDCAPACWGGGTTWHPWTNRWNIWAKSHMTYSTVYFFILDFWVTIFLWILNMLFYLPNTFSWFGRLSVLVLCPPSAVVIITDSSACADWHQRAVVTMTTVKENHLSKLQGLVTGSPLAFELFVFNHVLHFHLHSTSPQ